MFATLPLSYCTNVHPGTTVDAVIDGLRQYTVPLRERVGPLAAGLWLAASVADELEADATKVSELRRVLSDGGLVCYTLNAFPYGNFHDDVVKEAVYRPDWSTEERLGYTLRCARLLAQLMPDGVQGSLSTVPLGFKPAAGGNDWEAACVRNIIACARALDALHDETGRVIRLAIEPEPCCVLETTPEVIAFFETLRAAADEDRTGEDRAAVETHIGVCYDVCHQSVEFEDVVRSLRDLRDADIRINKVHISCAVETPDPSDPAQRDALAAYAEPRYLHQTFVQHEDRSLTHQVDLTTAWCLTPPGAAAAAKRWRTHYHVPVDADRLGPLRTTRPDLARALAAVRALSYAPHLEIETYTWSVLPGEQPDLVDGLAKEVEATRRLLDQLSASPPPSL